jgi:hypothetical protein
MYVPKGKPKLLTNRSMVWYSSKTMVKCFWHMLVQEIPCTSICQLTTPWSHLIKNGLDLPLLYLHRIHYQSQTLVSGDFYTLNVQQLMGCMLIQIEVNTQICTSQKPIGIQDEGMNAYIMWVLCVN